uniref:Uncharacterized protein n=1 Tax=Arundo donax TaxID=35708 RepID=A0A0A8XRB9_ARUDO
MLCCAHTPSSLKEKGREGKGREGKGRR